MYDMEFSSLAAPEFVKITGAATDGNFVFSFLCV